VVTTAGVKPGTIDGKGPAKMESRQSALAIQLANTAEKKSSSVEAIQIRVWILV
jgi:hypothetical protein